MTIMVHDNVKAKEVRLNVYENDILGTGWLSADVDGRKVAVIFVPLKNCGDLAKNKKLIGEHNGVKGVWIYKYIDDMFYVIPPDCIKDDGEFYNISLAITRINKTNNWVAIFRIFRQTHDGRNIK